MAAASLSGLASSGTCWYFETPSTSATRLSASAFVAIINVSKTDNTKREAKRRQGDIGCNLAMCGLPYAKL